MSGVADCLARSVAAGTISKKTADSARQMHQRMQRDFTAEMGPASADASAALAAAKALRSQSAAKIRYAAAQVETFNRGEMRVRQHPGGTRAGLISMVTRDLWRDTKAFRDLPMDSPVKRGGSVEGRSKAIARNLTEMFATGVQKFKPGTLGFTKEQLTGIDNTIREIFGVDTGDAVAKSAAQGFQKATDYAVNRVQAAGKIFTPLEDWRVPQYWKGWRVKDFGPDAFKADVIKEADAGRLTIFDRDTGKPVTMANRDAVLDRAWRDIVYGGGPSAPFSKETRTFNFAGGKDGAEAWLRLQKKYGPGTNIMEMLMGHLDRMSKETALSEVFGPSYEANFKALQKMAEEEPAIPSTTIAGWNPARLVTRMVESKRTVEGVWNLATGQIHSAHDEWLTGLMGGLRNMNVASALHQAVFSVLPSDTVTQALAAGHLGMDPISHVARVFTGGVSKADAQHLGIQAHQVMDFVNNLRDYEDHVSIYGATNMIAKTAVRATGLNAWGAVGKRTFAGDMLNFFARQLDIPFDKLDGRFRTFLNGYGFDAADWAKLQGVDRLDLNGARYLNPSDLQAKDNALYERVMSAIDEQGSFAMHQPDFRIRAIEQAAYVKERGFQTELWRSFMQFKTFALSRMTTHMMRLLTDGDISNRVVFGTAFAILGTAAGAASLQALQLVNGKDLRDMHKASFWGEAMLKGGMAGYYGELINAAMRGNLASSDVLTSLAGPSVHAFQDALRLAVSPIKEEFDPETGRRKQTTIGRAIISTLSRNTPSTWYTKLAVDRLIWDKLQTLIDPDYRKSWRRIEKQNQKDSGANFFWPRGETMPTRAPALGTAFGR